MTIIGIDPGVRTFGWAMLKDGELHNAGGLSSDPNTKPLAAAAKYFGTMEELFLRQPADKTFYVVEQMEWRPGSVQRPSDLLGVQLVGGYFVGRLVSMEAVIHCPKPSRWKNPQPKHIHHALLAEKIPRWAEVIEALPKNQREHAADAAGLAWWLHCGGQNRV